MGRRPRRPFVVVEEGSGAASSRGVRQYARAAGAGISIREPVDERSPPHLGPRGASRGLTECLQPAPGEKRTGSWIPDPALKLRARARSSPAAAWSLGSSLLSDGALPRTPRGHSAGTPSAPLRIRETRTCASCRVIVEATPKADASLRRHACVFRAQARGSHTRKRRPRWTLPVSPRTGGFLTRRLSG